jgi:hypothetical protein
MSKVLRVLATAGLAAVAASALFLGASVASADTPDAPSVFAGNVTLDGAPAPLGTVIESRIAGNTTCATYIVVGTPGIYTIQHPAYDPNAFPCGGTLNQDVQFYVNGLLATESPNGVWDNRTGQNVNLSAVTPPTATATVPGDGTPGVGTATATATAKPPVTGQGLSSGSGSSGAAWALLALGAGAVAFGASGVAVARRSR